MVPLRVALTIEPQGPVSGVGPYPLPKTPRAKPKATQKVSYESPKSCLKHPGGLALPTRYLDSGNKLVFRGLRVLCIALFPVHMILLQH